MNRIVLAVALAIGALIAGSPALAQTGKAEGEVRKVDKAAGKLTVKHGPIEGMDMPPMTMVFRTRDAALLDRVNPGDKIAFTVAKEQNTLTITSVEVK